MTILKNVNTSALNLNIITMEDLNRLKLCLLNRRKLASGLQSNLVLALRPQADGAQMHHSQIFKH